jgi:RNA polymerase sigma factor (sigma-70 family)
VEKIREILQDKETGLKWLFENYGKKLLGYSISVYKVSEDTGWDLVYKTIYKVQEVYSRYDFENEQKFASFIFRMFINFLKNHIRDENTKTQGAVFIPIDETRRNYVSVSSAKTIENAPLKKLQEELAKLEDWQRILLLMRSQDVAYSEIARYVNKPENQLKVYYSRLKISLSQKLQGFYPVDNSAENVEKEATVINIKNAS